MTRPAARATALPDTLPSSLEEAIAAVDRLGVGAPTLTETGIVLAHQFGEESTLLLAWLVEGIDLRVVPFTAAHGREAHPRPRLEGLRCRIPTAR